MSRQRTPGLQIAYTGTKDEMLHYLNCRAARGGDTSPGLTEAVKILENWTQTFKEEENKPVLTPLR